MLLSGRHLTELVEPQIANVAPVNVYSLQLDGPGDARDTTWSMFIAAIDPDPGKAPALKKWARSYWEAVHP